MTDEGMNFGKSAYWPNVVARVNERAEERRRWKHIESIPRQLTEHAPFEVVR